MSNHSLALRVMIAGAALSLAAGSASAATSRSQAQTAAPTSQQQAAAAAQGDATGVYTCNHASELRSRLERRVCED